MAESASSAPSGKYHKVYNYYYFCGVSLLETIYVRRLHLTNKVNNNKFIFHIKTKTKP